MRIHKLLIVLFLMSIVALAQTAPPTGLTAAVSGTTYKSVNLSWQYDSTITNVKYNVYKKTGLLSDTIHHFSKIATTFNKAFVDKNVSIGKQYSYYVTAVKSNLESVASNKVEVDIPAPVIAYGKISGVVVADSTMAPIYRANVQIWVPQGNDPGPGNFVSVMTDSNGRFTAKLRTGTYLMWTGAYGFINEYYNNVLTVTEATPIVVAQGDSLVFDITLAKKIPPVTYTVQGSVVTEGGLPVMAEVTAYSTKNHGPSCGFNYRTHTDSLGNYTISVKGSDSIVVFASSRNQGLKNQYYNNKETFATADILYVTANTTGINFILHPVPVYANGISGEVKDSAGTLVPAKGMVFVYRKTSGHLGFRKGIKADSLTGAYSFANLEPGLYYLSAQAPGYKPTYFTYSGTPTLNWRLADSVVVTETGVVGGINFNLRLNNHPHGNAVVYGYVKGSNAVVDGALNYIVDQNGDFVDYSVSDVDGSYYVANAGVGNYELVSSLVNFNESRTPVTFEETGTLLAYVDVNLTPSNVTSVGSDAVISSYALGQNYPNPFNPSTVISYRIPQNTLVSLKVYNVLGKEVATLVNEQQSAGQHFVTFNASNLASGIYLYKIQAGDFSAVKKLTLIK